MVDVSHISNIAQSLNLSQSYVYNVFLNAQITESYTLFWAIVIWSIITLFIIILSIYCYHKKIIIEHNILTDNFTVAVSWIIVIIVLSALAGIILVAISFYYISSVNPEYELFKLYALKQGWI